MMRGIMKAGVVKLAMLGMAVLGATSVFAQSDPLASWNDGPAKSAITSFVARVTTEGRKDFVKPEERIATFDNDGTLWCGQPMYFQAFFAFDRIKEMAPQHPEWKDTEPCTIRMVSVNSLTTLTPISASQIKLSTRREKKGGLLSI